MVQNGSSLLLFFNPKPLRGAKIKEKKWYNKKKVCCVVPTHFSDGMTHLIASICSCRGGKRCAGRSREVRGVEGLYAMTAGTARPRPRCFGSFRLRPGAPHNTHPCTHARTHAHTHTHTHTHTRALVRAGSDPRSDRPVRRPGGVVARQRPARPSSARGAA